MLLDSCILIDYLAGRSAARMFIAGSPGSAISLVTWMEVMVGASSSDEERVLRGFLRSFVVLPVDPAVAEEAVVLRRRRRLKLPDAIILATARVHERVLATRNVADFPGGPVVVIPYRVEPA